MHVLKAAWVATAAVALAVLPVPGGDNPTRTYRNGIYLFSMKVFPDWTEVPIQIDEKTEIAKFYEPVSRGDYFQPELYVVRIDKRPNGGANPVTGADPKKEKPTPLVIEGPRPKSAFEYVFDRAPGGSKDVDPKSFKKITSADKVEGKLWVHESTLEKGSKDKALSAVTALAAFEKDNVEYGITLQGPARRRDDFELAIKSIAKSFLFFDPKAKAGEALEILDGVNITAKRRTEIEKGLIKGWGIEVSPKKNYVIIYNTKANKNKQLAKTIAERIEKIREQVYETQFPPAQPVTAVSIVRVCGDRTEYHAYGGPGGSAGYWNSDAEELVFYDASPARKVDDDTLAVLYHEAFHQYIYYSVGNVAPHSWFNEGHGDYYAGAKYTSSGKFKIGPFNWRVGTVKTAITEGPRAFTVKKDEKTGVEHRVYTGTKGYTPLKDLVAFSQGEYYSYPGVSYAQGWSLIYFLREGVPKNKQWNAKWGKILDKYFAALKREVSKEGKLTRGGGDPEPGKPTGPVTPNDPTPPDPKEPTDPTPPAPKDGPTPPAPPSPKEPGDPTPPDGPDGGTDEPPPDPGLQPMQIGESSESALQVALREAFDGVDFDELEAAWIDFTKHGK
jgi:hypothetical protein